MEPLFHIVMHEPEIPNNTGNIGRTCLTTACRLHLIHPLGFETTETACRRAGLDYWPRVDVHEHPTWEAYRERTRVGESRLWLFSTKGEHLPWEVNLQRGDHLVFGKETAGLPAEILDQFPQRTLRFPMMPNERSLNVATAVCAAICEGVRRLQARGEIDVDEAGCLKI